MATSTNAWQQHGNNRRGRFILGVCALLAVVAIWVLSSELTRFIFVHEKFNRPFFTTYFKTSLFTLYLTGFLFMPNWRHLCWATAISQSGYTRVADASDSDDEGEEEEGIEEEEEEEEEVGKLGDPQYVPVHFDSSSDAESIASSNGIAPATYAADQLAEIAQDCLLRQQTQQQQQQQLYDGLRECSPLIGPQPRPEQQLLEARRKGVKFSRVSEVRQLSDSEAQEASLARLSYSAYQRALRNRDRQVSIDNGERLTVMEVAKVSLLFCLIWFAGNWSYQEALNHSPAGVVNVVSTSSSLFTLLLSAAFPSEQRDQLTLTKLLAVLLCCCGVALISWSDMTKFHAKSHIPWGTVLALFGSLCYAIYLVMLKRRLRTDNAVSFPMFFGFVGLFNALLLWPGFYAVHYTGLEHFHLPNSTDWGYLTVNGIVGTTLSELLWLWGCFLSSSLLATLSLSLTIPFTMIADFFLFKVQYDWRFYCGSIPVFLSFILVALVSNADDPSWDPALTLLKRLCSCSELNCDAGQQQPASANQRQNRQQQQQRRRHLRQRAAVPVQQQQRRRRQQQRQQQQQQQQQVANNDNNNVATDSINS